MRIMRPSSWFPSVMPICACGWASTKRRTHTNAGVLRDLEVYPSGHFLATFPSWTFSGC